MMRVDAVVGGLFVAFGGALLASGASFPPGVGGLPGAGFFPQVIGGLTVLLAGALLAGQRKRRPEGLSIANPRQVLGTAVLLLVYLLLWGSGFFVVRTVVFLLLTLRFLGQRWSSAVGYSVALTAFVYLAFDAGLNVSLE